MTKQEFKYITEMNDEQIDSVMLLDNMPYPEDGDWIEVLRAWYSQLCEYALKK